VKNKLFYIFIGRSPFLLTLWICCCCWSEFVHKIIISGSGIMG